MILGFIIYLLVIMQNLDGGIWAMSQLPISVRCAKNAYQYQHACRKCISISACMQEMHINDVTMKKYVTTNKSIVFIYCGNFSWIVCDK
jgi:hypothetical protein